MILDSITDPIDTLTSTSLIMTGTKSLVESCSEDEGDPNFGNNKTNSSSHSGRNFNAVNNGGVHRSSNSSSSEDDDESMSASSAISCENAGSECSSSKYDSDSYETPNFVGIRPLDNLSRGSKGPNNGQVSANANKSGKNENFIESAGDASTTETDGDFVATNTDAAVNSASEIREVWSHNLYEEFVIICQMVKKYPFVAMDTEFPGIVAKPSGGSYVTMEEYKYQLVKCNVDMLKMIQLGFTLFDFQGNRPDGVCTWQFNFKFNLDDDLYAEDSIGLLVNSGIRFELHRTEGIDPGEFAELLLTSGLVLMDNITWLTFHSAYDFGYLLSQLTCRSLPESEVEFLENLRLYFPNMYDIKFLMSSTEGIPMNGGLQKIADELQVKRIGSQHQAGSDSLLTGQVFFKLYEQYFKDGMDDVKYNGQICGLGGSSHMSLVSNTPGRRRRGLGAGSVSNSPSARNGHLFTPERGSENGSRSPTEMDD